MDTEFGMQWVLKFPLCLYDGAEYMDFSMDTHIIDRTDCDIDLSSAHHFSLARNGEDYCERI